MTGAVFSSNEPALAASQSVQTRLQIKISAVLRRDGYDRFGLDKDGFNVGGFDKYGFDRAGFDKDGYDVNGFSHEGYDVAGYNKEGFDKCVRGRRLWRITQGCLPPEC